MKEEIRGLKGLLQSLAEESHSEASAHIASEQLTAYYFKELPSDEASRTQEHLIICRECTALLLDLAAFCAPVEDESSQSSPTEAEAAWTELRAQIPALSQLPRLARSSKTSFFSRLGGLIFPLHPVHALSALLLVFSLLLAFWMAALNRENRALLAQLKQGQSARDLDNLAAQNALAESAKEIEEAKRRGDEALNRAEQLEGQLDKSRSEINKLMRPQLNIPIEDLLEDEGGETRASGGARQTIELPADATRFTLNIPYSAPELNYPDYAIEIVNKSNAIILASKGLQPKSEAGFTIALPCRLLPAGEYRFNVYGIGRGKRERVAGGVALIQYKKNK